MVDIRSIRCPDLILAQGSADNYCRRDVVLYVAEVRFRFITPQVSKAVIVRATDQSPYVKPVAIERSITYVR